MADVRSLARVLWTPLLRHLWLLAILAIGAGTAILVVSNNVQLRTTPEHFWLSPDDIQILEQRVRLGEDSSAALRLARFYGYSVDDPYKEQIWLQRAADLGSIVAKTELRKRRQDNDRKQKPTEPR